MHLRVRSEALESDVRQKDKEIESLNQRLEDQANLYSSSVKSEDKLKVCALPPVTRLMLCVLIRFYWTKTRP